MNDQIRTDGADAVLDYQVLFESLPGLYLVVANDEPRFTVVAASTAYCQATLSKRSEMLGKSLLEVFPEESDDSASGAALRASLSFVLEHRLRHTLPVQQRAIPLPGGSFEERYWSPVNSPVVGPDNDVAFIIHSLEDLTEVVRRDALIVAGRKFDDQFLQARKLESIGRLAGGIAHDFNNLLTTIIGYSELSLDMIPDDNPARPMFGNVIQAAERAANLTRQLLAFARKQIVEPRSVNLNDVIAGFDRMLRRLIAEDIELVTVPGADLRAVKVDVGQFEQVLVNLVLNSRDAMPNGGKITIETHNVDLDEECTHRHADVTPGKYVMTAVTDTGSGMDESVRLHVFDPFFTTKEQGRGTGLGLSTVYGIVRQAGGHIWLYSEPGAGVTFKICLPQCVSAIEASSQAATPIVPLNRVTETVLVVEDEPAVRSLTTAVLRKLGYTVHEASNGEEALDLALDCSQQIDLVMTDVVMPGMSGSELARRLRQTNPRMKALFSSGYTETAIVRHGVLEKGVTFLPKPFTPVALTRKVREALDG